MDQLNRIKLMVSTAIMQGQDGGWEGLGGLSSAGGTSEVGDATGDLIPGECRTEVSLGGRTIHLGTLCVPVWAVLGRASGRLLGA